MQGHKLKVLAQRTAKAADCRLTQQRHWGQWQYTAAAQIELRTQVSSAHAFNVLGHRA